MTKPVTAPEWLVLVKGLQTLQDELAANKDTDGAVLLIQVQTWIRKAAAQMGGDPG